MTGWVYEWHLRLIWGEEECLPFMSSCFMIFVPKTEGACEKRLRNSVVALMWGCRSAGQYGYPVKRFSFLMALRTYGVDIRRGPLRMLLKTMQNPKSDIFWWIVYSFPRCPWITVGRGCVCVGVCLLTIIPCWFAVTEGHRIPILCASLCQFFPSPENGPSFNVEWSRAVALRFQNNQEGSLKHRMLASPSISDSLGLTGGLRICIGNNFPGGATAAVSGARFV